MGTNCDVVLLARTFESDNTFAQTHLEWLRLIDSSNYDKAKTDLAASVPGYFDGSYHDFKQMLSQYHSQEWYSKSDLAISSRVRSYVPDAAFAAWQTCIMSTQPGSGTIPIQCSNIDATGADVIVQWEPVAGTLGALFNCGVSITGGIATGKPFWTVRGKKGFTGRTSFRVTRNTSDSVISIRVYGRTKNGVSFVGAAKAEPPPPPPHALTWRDDFKKANSGTLKVGPVQKDMNVEFTFIYTSSYENAGDPWREMTTYIDNLPFTHERQQSFGQNDTLTAQTTRSLTVGQTLEARADVQNYRTVSVSLVISARQL